MNAKEKKAWTGLMAMGVAMTTCNLLYSPYMEITTKNYQAMRTKSSKNIIADVSIINNTVKPTLAPTVAPTIEPTLAPTVLPTAEPTAEPTVEPTLAPTIEPTTEPTLTPTVEPTAEPTVEPTLAPTVAPTAEPTIEPTVEPTVAPKSDKYDFNSKFFQDFDKEERFCLYRIVEAEVTDQSYDCKKNVAAVIINRVRDTSGEFPNTIHDVVYQKKQFAPISDGRFWQVTITEETKQACIEAYNEGYTAKGALYFANIQDVKVLRTKEWFKSLSYLFGDSSGHSFYK